MELHRTVFSRLFKGKKFERFATHAPDFISEKIGEMLYAPAVKELQEWKKRGAHLLLLSSSPDFLVKMIASSLGIDTSYGTQYLIDNDGCLSGLGYLLDGKWKADFVKEELKRHELEVSIAYSDHIHDLPFLESVSHPIVVNPERRLRKLARSRGWKILQ